MLQPLQGRDVPGKWSSFPRKSPSWAAESLGGTHSQGNGSRMGVLGPCSCFALAHSAEQLHHGRVGVSLVLAHTAGSCLFPQPGNPLTFRRGEEPRTPLALAPRSFGKRRPWGQTGSPQGTSCPGARVLSALLWGWMVQRGRDRTWRGPPRVGQSCETSPGRAAGSAGSKVRLMQRRRCRPAAAASAMAAPPARFLCRGQFPIDPALPLLGTSSLGGRGGSTALTRIWVIAFQHSGLGAKIEVNHMQPGAIVRKACEGA